MRPIANHTPGPGRTVGRTKRSPALGLLLAVAVLTPSAAPLAAAAKRTTAILAEGTRWATPCYVQDSGVPGPTVVIVAGVHGNEPAGPYAADAIRHWPIRRGKLIVLPRANSPALRANKRESPDVAKAQGNLNRNFPRPGKAEPARGTPATEIWQLLTRHKPAWLVDLHESYGFRQVEKKSLGSTIVVHPTSQAKEAASAMLDAVNATIQEDTKKFIRLRSPVGGSLARAAAEHLGTHAMIVETGRKSTDLSTRARQHRVLVHALLRHLRMIDGSVSVHRLTGRRGESGPIRVALYDAAGAGGKGIPRLLNLLGRWKGAAILPIGVSEIHSGALPQFDVVIFPGGSGSAQARALGEAGRKHVRAFVRSGGGYVGICGGAYLAASGFSWGLKILDAKTISPKWRRGKGTVKLELTQRGREILGGPRGRFDCRYANGPILKPHKVASLPDYTSLAVFRTEIAENDSPKGVMVNSPALLCGRYAKGRVLVSSPHPEQADALDALVLRAVAWAAGRDPSTVQPPPRVPPGSASPAQDPAGVGRSANAAHGTVRPQGLRVQPLAAHPTTPSPRIVYAVPRSRALAAASPVPAAPPARAEYALKDGDTVVFLGDSITAARTYGKIIENYTLLRFPDRKVRFYTAGIGGDTAAKAVERLERDVFAHGATVVTVCFGMNDVGWGTQADAEHVKAYLDALRTIVRECRKRKARVIYLTPPVTAADPRKSQGDFLQKLADDGARAVKSTDGDVIDVQRGMRAIQRRVWAANAARKDQKAKVSLHLADGVHLSDLGQMAMAFVILQGLGAPREVSDASLDGARARVLAQRGCRITGVRLVEGRLEFTRLDEGLPINFGLFGALQFQWVPFPAAMNRYGLTVKGLPAGSWQVQADGRPIGAFDAATLARGIDIASRTASAWAPGGPWDAQASVLSRLTDARHALATAGLLDALWLAGSGVLAPRAADLRRADAALTDLQRAAARPRPYRFVLRPATPGKPK